MPEDASGVSADGLVIDGRVVPVSGLVIRSFCGDPALRLVCVDTPDGPRDCKPRSTAWIRGIVLHATPGRPDDRNDAPQRLRPGLGPSGPRAADIVRGWRADRRHAGAHLVVDLDGAVVCCADLAREGGISTGSAPLNDATISIELCQGRELELYEGQLAAAVRLIDYLTIRFGIQRQFHAPYRYMTPVPRIQRGATDVIGLFGHRDFTDNRGPGDPGDFIYDKLRDAGYEAFDYARDEDLRVWQQRQAELNGALGCALPTDGLPAERTCAALLSSGRRGGLWVPRPSDEADAG